MRRYLELELELRRYAILVLFYNLTCMVYQMDICVDVRWQCIFMIVTYNRNEKKFKTKVSYSSRGFESALH
jgi:hypothetical protein